MSEEEEKGHRVTSLRPDSIVDRDTSGEGDFIESFDSPERPDLFDASSEYSGLELSILDPGMQDKSNELFSSGSQEPEEDGEENGDYTGDDE
jgi:hypothetical protein